jgi:hypothetical protein
MISDVVVLRSLPEEVLKSVGACLACVSGAAFRTEYLSAIQTAGFEKVEVLEQIPAPADLIQGDPVGKTILEGLGLTPEK